jgi:hypothetical protein
MWTDCRWGKSRLVADVTANIDGMKAEGETGGLTVDGGKSGMIADVDGATSGRGIMRKDEMTVYVDV